MTSGWSFGLAQRFAAKEFAVGDRLPYAYHLDAETLACRDGTLLQIIRIDGFSSETADDEELAYRKQIRETLLRSIADSRLALYHHIVRRPVLVAPEGGFTDPYCQSLDEDWRARLDARVLYTNEHYLTLVQRPLQGGVGWIERLFRAARPADNLQREDLRRLTAAREAVLATLAPYRARSLGVFRDAKGEASELAAFIALLLGGDLRRVATSAEDIGQQVPDRRLTFGLEAMEQGAGGGSPRQYGAMVSLKDYPALSAPGLLDGVMRLPHALVLTESFSFLERQASLGRMGLALRRLRAADDDAFSLRDELAAARDDVGAGRAAYGEHHLTIMVRSPDLAALDGAVADVQAALGEAGGVGVREDINLEPAFWAQFPANFAFIARKAMISAANFASFASFHNQPSGQALGNHWGPAVATLETTASGPYHFNFHSSASGGDLGNFTVIGPSGAGKTVLITFLLAQAQKFAPRILFFDKDRGCEPFIRAARGAYHRLRHGGEIGFNPLRLPDSPATRAFLREWLALLLGGAERLDVDDLATIADAIDANFDADPGHRRLRYLREMLAGARRPKAGDLVARLRPWCEDGEHAWLFDNEDDSLALDHKLYGFDMTELLDNPVLRTPAMLYLFHRIEQALDGQPVIIVIDEGWKALDDEVFSRRLKDWQKTIRKRNGIVGFCTQSAGDALESRIAAAIIEQAATQIFLPNPKARAGDYIEGFGLSAHEFELVRSLPDTARAFLVKQGDHSVVSRLDLTGLEDHLAVLAGTERSVRLLDRLRAELGDDPEDWLGPFMDQAQRGRR